MPLEFNRLVEQVQTMGRHLGHRSLSISNRLDDALALFYAATDLAPIHERIALVRRSSISGYRGAAALDEVVCQTFPRPEAPPSATFVAADGSQIYPDPHAPALYYLVNVSAFVYAYGESSLPRQFTEPSLYYADADLLDADGRLISNQTVNARRTLAEMQMLAKQAWLLRDEARPLVAVHDGSLLKFFGGHEIADARRIGKDYLDSLAKLDDARATLAGYIDRPYSKYVISLLHLMRLTPEEINDLSLKTNGDLEGLLDVHLFRRVLRPGERSAIMTQNSPQNKDYRERDLNFEIAFFYLNVSDSLPPNIVRVDVPMWVARDTRAVNELHALILAQCAIQGRRHYPYALTRADELAYVSGGDKQQLNDLIGVELTRNRVLHESSNKQQTKGLARGSKRQHRLRSG